MTAKIRKRRLLVPTEHGSWAFAFEPVAIGLLVAPSWAGVCLGISTAAGFLARKPISIAWSHRNPDTDLRAAARRAAYGLGAAALAGFLIAAFLAGARIALPFFAAAPVVFYFIWEDRHKRARHFPVEAAAIGLCTVPLVAIALAAGWSSGAATALGAVNLARAWPTMLLVRTLVRRRRGEAVSVVPAVVAQCLAPAVLTALASMHALPWTVVLLNGVLSARALILLAPFTPRFTAKQVGISEGILGILHVVALAVIYSPTVR